MHISEGVLSAPVLISGAALAALGTAAGLKGLDEERLPRVALLSSAFFVASLIHVPIGPSSIHLVLNGLVGLLAGRAAVPAILVALLLQGVLFQYGGLTTLGVNTVIMAAPAVACHYLFRAGVGISGRWSTAAAAGCGALAVCLSGLLVALSLMATEGGFRHVAGMILAAHVPVMVIEAIITAGCVGFLRKVRPEMLPPLRSAKKGISVAVVLLTALASVALLAATAGPALAHNVTVFAWVDGDTVRVETKFSGGRAAKESPIRVLDATGAEVLSGVTAEDGTFSFPLPPRERTAGGLTLELQAGMGHRAEWTIRPEELGPAAPAGTESVPAPAPGMMAGMAPGPGPGLTPDQLSGQITAAVEKALDRKLGPVLKSLAESRQEQGARVSDIVAGIGYILGLAGMYLYALTRRKERRS